MGRSHNNILTGKKCTKAKNPSAHPSPNTTNKTVCASAAPTSYHPNTQHNKLPCHVFVIILVPLSNFFFCFFFLPYTQCGKCIFCMLHIYDDSVFCYATKISFPYLSSRFYMYFLVFSFFHGNVCGVCAFFLFLCLANRKVA